MYANTAIEYGNMVEIPGTDVFIISVILKQTHSNLDGGQDWAYSNLLFFNRNTGKIRYIEADFDGYIDDYFWLGKLPELPPDSLRNDDYDPFWSEAEEEWDHSGDWMDVEEHLNAETHPHIVRLTQPNPSNNVYLMIHSYRRLSEISNLYEKERGTSNDTMVRVNYLAMVDYISGSFRVLTPPDKHLTYLSFCASRNAMMAHTLSETVHDYGWNDGDREDIYFLDMGKSTVTAQPLVNDTLYDKLKRQFISRMWKYDDYIETTYEGK